MKTAIWDSFSANKSEVIRFLTQYFTISIGKLRSTLATLIANVQKGGGSTWTWWIATAQTGWEPDGIDDSNRTKRQQLD